ncbi:MAG TPA: flavodoxin domain-containing protein [Methanomassiliicoccales archaeon]|nr:flavodoxin domain-containing protein [Methanomassiliicoccales archaeon]
MKILVAYDSVSKAKMTKHVAELIALAIREKGAIVDLHYIKDSDKPNVEDYDAFIVGSPTMAWRPTPETIDYLETMRGKKIAGKPAAAFDTQIKSIASGNGTKGLEKKMIEIGFKVVQPALLAYVEGPRDAYELKAGELERIKAWGAQMASALK